MFYSLSRIAVSHYAAARTDCIQGAELECVINDLFLPMHSALWAVHLKLKPITLSNWISLKLRSGIYLSSLSLSLCLCQREHKTRGNVLDFALCCANLSLFVFSLVEQHETRKLETDCTITVSCAFCLFCSALMSLIDLDICRLNGGLHSYIFYILFLKLPRFSIFQLFI